MRLRARWPEGSILMELLKKSWCGVDSVPPTRVLMGVTDRDAIGQAVGCGAREIQFIRVFSAISARMGLEISYSCWWECERSSLPLDTMGPGELGGQVARPSGVNSWSWESTNTAPQYAHKAEESECKSVERCPILCEWCR